MSREGRGCMELSREVSVLGERSYFVGQAWNLTVVLQISQHCWFQGRMDAVQFCLLQVQSTQGCCTKVTKT